MIECRPGARLWGPQDEDSVREAGIDLFLLNVGNAYDGLACLFGIRNAFGFRPLAEERGLPDDASDGLRSELAAYGGPDDAHGTTWLTWAEPTATDWQERDASGTRSRAAAAGTDTDWGRAWSVMSILSDVHGAENVRRLVPLTYGRARYPFGGRCVWIPCAPLAVSETCFSSS